MQQNVVDQCASHMLKAHMQVQASLWCICCNALSDHACVVQAITRVIEAQDQLVESAKLGTDKPSAAKS